MARRALVAVSLVAALAGETATAQTSGRAGPPRLCPEDAPPGVHLPDRPGCGTPAEPRLRAGAAPGTYEIAPGTTLKVGGRVRLDYDAHR